MSDQKCLPVVIFCAIKTFGGNFKQRSFDYHSCHCFLAFSTQRLFGIFVSHQQKLFVSSEFRGFFRFDHQSFTLDLRMMVEDDLSRWGNVGHAKEATLGECLPGGIVDDDILTEAGEEGRFSFSPEMNHWG